MLKIALVLLPLLFFGCSSKSLYKPETTQGSVSFDGKLPSKIVSVTTDGATLENGQIITKTYGLLDLKLPQGYRFLSDVNGFIAAGDPSGNLIIMDSSANVVAKSKLDSEVATAAYKNGKTAVVTADNTAILYDSSFQPLFVKKNIDPMGLNANIASPIFLGTDLVIFPTLDGKLQILDMSQLIIVKDIVISDEKHFNNVMFFDVIDDRLVAATAHKVMSINPRFINTYQAEIADVIFIGKAIYIFTQDGRIVLTDPDLKVVKEQKYKFARFAGEVYGSYIYAVERQGYLIATDKDLTTSNVYQFNTSFTGWFTNTMQEYIFTNKDAIYYGDRYYKLAK